MSATRIALLIDGENIGADQFPEILEQAGHLGTPVIKRLFGLRKDWEPVVRTHALKVEWQATAGKGKNTVDIAMTVHAMDIVHRALVDAICLVSSDCDFQPLAVHLREAGVTVYGMGEEKTNESLRNAYAEFRLLPKLAAAPAKATMKTPASPAGKPVGDIEAAIMGLLPQDGAWVRLAALGSNLRRDRPDVSAALKNGRLAKRIGEMAQVQKQGTGAAIEVRRRIPN